MCKQHNRTASNPFLNGTKDSAVDGACERRWPPNEVTFCSITKICYWSTELAKKMVYFVDLNARSKRTRNRRSHGMWTVWRSGRPTSTARRTITTSACWRSTTPRRRTPAHTHAAPYPTSAKLCPVQLSTYFVSTTGQTLRLMVHQCNSRNFCFENLLWTLLWASSFREHLQKGFCNLFRRSIRILVGGNSVGISVDICLCAPPHNSTQPIFYLFLYRSRFGAVRTHQKED